MTSILLPFLIVKLLHDITNLPPILPFHSFTLKIPPFLIVILLYSSNIFHSNIILLLIITLSYRHKSIKCFLNESQYPNYLIEHQIVNEMYLI